MAGYVDIHPNNDGSGYSGFAGTWGVYPFFESGCIIASDDVNGLNMMQLDWQISDTCTPIVELSNTIANDVYSASNYLRSDGIVPSNSNVVYQAEFAVELNPGFEVDANADFEAKIENCIPNN